MKIFQKFKEWICRKFGHKFDLSEIFIAYIVNEDYPKNTDGCDKITCLRCGVVVSYRELENTKYSPYNFG